MHVLPVPSYNTRVCGRINILKDRVFHCPHCGFALDRDLNACFKKGGCHPW
ncbi:hypothetical protein B9Q13_03805 [Candidatus Marsarchaeota G2 archaeon ECH_B_SAG-G16]|uniref:Cas12f1-like TNB domain-containing protein n=1 Tax=Candidatus Marsarchaeota G2 archaeon ECH_B_SAG-G16 TaxID=1978167 RepID=A0A2R6C1D6_9ARCH|nr:MAG: hypothetical protein B9Q13_03805 [Candidatus Marsarchaeota G2 archaeon ECH_B_SAG-G16]